MPDPLLIPKPKSLRRLAGSWSLPDCGTISLNFRDDAVLAAAITLRKHLPQNRPHRWRIATLDEPINPSLEIHLRLDPVIADMQGYHLQITRDGVLARAQTHQGIFYALQTLIQIARTSDDKSWPAIDIQDSPDFQRRGFYHDISRGKVPKLATILQLVDDLAAVKINEFQLYIENVFAFQKHPDMYDDTDPLTAEDLLQIDAACRSRFIDFVPSITSLGHFEKILRRPRYRPLAEAEPEDLRRHGVRTWSDNPWSLCVTDPAAKTLLQEMYAEFLPNFSSSHVNICCDESWDLGKGRSHQEAQRLGTGRLYIDWVNYCDSLARTHGKQIQLWGDIILNHPGLVADLPHDAIVLEWGYESDHPFSEHGKLFANSGRSFYVCPGTSSWQSLTGRTQNAFANMRAAAESGLTHQAIGFLNTDWGDKGHQQMLSVSLLPMAFGAAVAWNAHGTDDRHIVAAASLHIFGAESSDFARAVADLGDTSRRIARQRIANGSLDFFLLREPWSHTERLKQVKPAALAPQIARVTALRTKIASSGLTRPDGRLVLDELLFSADCLLHALKRTEARHAAINKHKRPSAHTLRHLSAQSSKLARDFKRLWLIRNKTSRLSDVLEHFQRIRREYGNLMAK